jgi:ParB family protein of integrating conjugative element (PFGI_1 class)
MLQEGHFGSPRELPTADPVAVTQLVVEIDRILPYDRNPRRERNPLYDEIKESVRAQGGLNNPLTITRRPDDTYYMVESGGNTRLQILKELWQEMHDERFHRIHCLFRPWVSEAHVLTAYLIENDKRGDLIFIDKALAIR